ncbi:hypothetical protein ATCC53582_02460 [Novacetimonas hansenii]|nr:hypothetical protein ATCC53582_02460 [Novacetimonas hansenii]
MIAGPDANPKLCYNRYNMRHYITKHLRPATLTWLFSRFRPNARRGSGWGIGVCRRGAIPLAAGVVIHDKGD